MPGKYHAQQVTIIVEHNARMIEACDSAMLTIRQVPNWQTYESLAGQMAYWKHAKAGFKWSTKIAEQQRES